VTAKAEAVAQAQAQAKAKAIDLNQTKPNQTQPNRAQEKPSPTPPFGAHKQGTRWIRMKKRGKTGWKSGEN